MLANFWLKNGHFETPTTKTDILTFLENKRLLREQLTSDYLST